MKRQIWMLSSTPLNYYINDMLNIIQENNKELSIGGRLVNCTWFVDDVVALTSNNELKECMKAHVMHINVENQNMKVVGKERYIATG